ncbi:SRPBCC family protein [Frankia sp. Cppng1_Ct_nod]|uniref:SRPBCC family protein n=1 Tax=Frankia sp. Cppng1_Ct_nod TaxID=2897162 RepID=UPI00104192C9|nr:SRPBCC family protein [Frankia sp. Cppng1_Ct_nod]
MPAVVDVAGNRRNAATLVVSIDVDADPRTVFAAMTDWERQGQWMLATTVVPSREGGVGVGGCIIARTGIGPLSIVDPMEIVEWEPPYRCLVHHTGRAVRGSGGFVVRPLPAGRSRVVWSEDLDLPLGLAGRIGFALLRPVLRVGLKVSLRRFARRAASGSTSGSAST